MEQHLKLNDQYDTSLHDPYIYHCLLGRLIYLIITQPDIVYIVNILNQFMHTSCVPRITVVTRVLHYIKGSPT